MTTAVIDWETAFAPGFAGVVCVLIEGIPLVLVPSGVVATATGTTTGTPDSLWWPGVGTLTITKPGGGTMDPVRAWLDTGATWTIHETARPTDGDVQCEPLRFDLFDVDGAASRLLSSPLTRFARALASDITAAGDIPLDSTIGVSSAGTLHIGREAVGYASLAGSSAVVTGTGAGRGLYGSRARAHVVGSGTRRATVVADTYPRFWQGRLVSVWLARLDGTTLYDPTLVYLGTVGAGVQVTSSLMRWQIPADHITTTLARKFGKVMIRAFGYQHVGGFTSSPLSVRFVNELALESDDDGGWSPDAATFITRLDRKGAGISPQIFASLSAGRAHLTATGPGGDITWQVYACWEPSVGGGTSPDLDATTGNALPECVMHLDGDFAVRRLGDWDQIPSTIAWTATVSGATGSASLALVADTDHTKKLFARITARTAATTTLSLTADVRGLSEAYDGTQPGARMRATLITRPTETTLGVMASGDTALAALRALAVALGDIQGTDAGDVVVDWDQVARVFASIPMPNIPSGRAYRFTGDEDSLLAPLIHEARLRGASLCMRRGRIGVYRPAQFATTEGTRRAIYEEDVLWGVPVEVTDGLEPTVSAMRFTMADGGSYTWRDTTSAEEFGEGKVVECRALESATRIVDVTAMASDIQRSAQQLLGVLAQPQRIIRVVVGPSFWDLDAGDLVTLTHASVPSWRGTRGLDAATCQVMEARKSFGGGECRVQLALLLSDDAALAGYAPSALVGSIAGAVVTIDTTSPWGDNCFALDVDADGNTITGQPLVGFAVGRRVQLVELNNETPMADESFDVVSLTATTVTLSASPSAPMVTAASTRYGCLLRFAPWTDGAVTDAQREYLYIADTVNEDLGSGGTPKRWAA